MLVRELKASITQEATPSTVESAGSTYFAPYPWRVTATGEPP